MFFFCKPKTIVLDAFTSDAGVADLLPPAPASKFRPKWWYDTNHWFNDKTNEGLVFKNNTIRRCQGFKDYYSDKSIIVPLWNSFILEYDANGSRVMFADNSSNFIEYHTPEIRGNKYLKDYHHFKIASPWRFKEKSGVNFLFSQPFYNFENPTDFIMPPAIVNYKYQHTTEVNFFVGKPKEGTRHRLSLDAGNPLIYLTPMTDKKVLVKVHKISKEEWKNIHIPILFFGGNYKKDKHLGYGK